MDKATFLRQFKEFQQQSVADGRFTPLEKDWFEILTDDTSTAQNYCTPYILHCGWAARVLMKTRPALHADFGSYIPWVAFASAIVDHFDFYDIRPENLHLPGLYCKGGALTPLDIPDNTYPSFSCLHVLEHIGLGRYGDML